MLLADSAGNNHQFHSLKPFFAQGFFTLKSSLYRSLFMGKEQTWNEDGRKDDDGY